MKRSLILTNINQLDASHNYGLTIGNFDGVHRGHQFLIKKLQELSVAQNEKLVLMTFVPHPRFVLGTKNERFLLNNYKQRRELLEQLGVEYIIEASFDRDFSTLSPDLFLKKFIVAHPNIKSLYLGHDFTFGSNKEGNFEFAKSALSPSGISVEILPRLVDAKISSSIIRDKLLKGDVCSANTMLGRSFYTEGLVVKGEGRGKKIGFPTANIKIDNETIIPERGVYVTETLYKGTKYKSVTNIGLNPTFTESEELNIETHIIDFDIDIYGELLRVSFLDKIRKEKKFESVNLLVEQINKDKIFARDYFEKD